MTTRDLQTRIMVSGLLLLAGCTQPLPPYTVQLDSKQAEMVETCWGNGWDARIQSDGDGGMQIACKAAY